MASCAASRLVKASLTTDSNISDGHLGMMSSDCGKVASHHLKVKQASCMKCHIPRSRATTPRSPGVALAHPGDGGGEGPLKYCPVGSDHGSSNSLAQHCWDYKDEKIEGEKYATVDREKVSRSRVKLTVTSDDDTCQEISCDPNTGVPGSCDVIT